MKLLLLFFAIHFTVLAQNGSEIYLLKLTKSADGYEARNPLNISNRSGYDNQPGFHPKKSIVYFSSQSNGQTDIWAYNYAAKKLTQVTNTEDSEYSPTVTSDQKYISCIVQRKSNGDQDLVKFSIDNPEKTQIILESQKAGKIGYHAWSQNNELVTFVLGEPNTLQLFENQSKSGIVLGKNIGRSLHYVKSKKAFSFVEKDGENWNLKLLKPQNQTVTTFAEALKDSEYYNAWNDAGVLFSSKDKELFFFETKSNTWKNVTLPYGFPSNKISRLAIKGNLLALVINE
ncbi:TolB family protein [Lacihabitans soyangensis]|uniref:S9 family peptidase n=1 Tax=Lacihabitans soyangensis TaxID=869394 RepID=A0AAE3H4G5_9BACT|nr:hypothetical protein [Lacihabitans soyangensis]MCP9764773.1 hypothetical protein [Lacihabitans soyangensis]